MNRRKQELLNELDYYVRGDTAYGKRIFGPSPHERKLSAELDEIIAQEERKRLNSDFSVEKDRY